MRKKNRPIFSRPYWRCTCCGQKLPDEQKHWGLIWQDKLAGMCSDCLTKIRNRLRVGE